MFAAAPRGQVHSVTARDGDVLDRCAPRRSTRCWSATTPRSSTCPAAGPGSGWRSASGRVGRARRRPRASSSGAPRGEPDSLISADAATWRAIARDLRGGMGAFRRGRLRRAPQPPSRGRLPRGDQRRRPGRAGSASTRLETARRAHLDDERGRRASRSSASTGSAARRPPSCPPSRARRDQPRDRDRPARVRRLGQAAERRLRRPVLRRCGGRGCSTSSASSAPTCRQQHGRPGRDRGRPADAGARRAARAAEPRGGLAARPQPEVAAAAAAAAARAAPADPAGDRRADRPPAGAGRRSRLERRRRRRVPALLPDRSRAVRVLRVGAQHLPRRAARRRRVLEPARGPGAARRCSSGAAGTSSCRSRS